MLVVSDSSPLNILVRIDLADVLGALCARVVIPTVVAAEMSHPNTPGKVRKWLLQRPTWLEVRSPSVVDTSLDVDPGEREAICLARELHADLLLVDDRAARNAAIQIGLAVTGTLGVLEQAAARQLLSLPQVVEKLRQTDFRLSEALFQQVLERDAVRHARREEQSRSPEDRSSLDF